MIERVRRWWQDTWLGRQNVTTDTGEDMSEELHEVEAHERDQTDMRETQQLLKESRAKSREASARLDDYQKRVQREYEKRIQIAKGSNRE